MASSRSDEVSLVLAGMDNSLFTYYLLEALQGKAYTRDDGLIRVFDVFDYISEAVPTVVLSIPSLKRPIWRTTLLSLCTWVESGLNPAAV